MIGGQGFTVSGADLVAPLPRAIPWEAITCSTTCAIVARSGRTDTLVCPPSVDTPASTEGAGTPSTSLGVKIACPTGATLDFACTASGAAKGVARVEREKIRRQILFPWRSLQCCQSRVHRHAPGRGGRPSRRDAERSARGRARARAELSLEPMTAEHRALTSNG